MRNLLKKLVGFSLGPILGAFISFITVPVTTYFINPTEFGKASMFTVVQTLIISFVYLGIDQSFAKEYHQHSDKKKLFQNSLFLPLVFSGFLTIVIGIFRRQFSNILFGSFEYGSISVLFCIMIIFMVIERYVLLMIRMEEKALEYSFFSVFLKVIIFALTFIIILSGERDFLAIVYSTIFGQIIGDLILIIKYREYFRVKRDFLDSILLKSLLRFGLPLVISASVTSLLNTTGRIFLRNYSTFTELGIYTAALKITSLLNIVQTSFTSFWIPTAYRWNSKNKDIKHFQLISELLLFVLSMGMMLLVFFKKYLMLILSNDYSATQYVFPLLCLTPLLYTLSETTTLGVIFSGKSYYNIYVTVCALIPNVILNILLVSKLGTIGTAIAQAVSYGVFYFLRTYFSKKCGFSFSTKKHDLCILVLFIVCCFNSFPIDKIAIINIIGFVTIVLIQIGTLKKLQLLKKEPSSWNFD
ncbi:oligosaccharide flippase family protein [Enterococcus viikkiensis]|uniref:Oligosaccharide flippase family protein n=1 Tax=Enterococcus viikkiensis TaxID=930854 RepID=A0ABU3FMM0_9ENTE|nr:oligosaccharide flippase family protein [Enterococcus viikkiensis]MDT2827208.1 oligosaccharide flippase family protein [Enterococcus viikkiensis]MDU6522453.1 oligosaccharide flippase family protein [Enterococcus sp.]